MKLTTFKFPGFVFMMLAGLLCLVLGGPPDARADLVLKGGSVTASFTDLGAQGFGNDPRLLTLQNNDTEAGQIIINSSGAPVAASYLGLNNVASPGPPSAKNNAPSLFDLGWNLGNQVSIGLNLDESGNQPHTVTLTNLVLNLYNNTGGIVGSFSLASSVLFDQAALDLQSGNGNAVFDFVLNAPEQSTFNTLTAGQQGSLFVGLAARLEGSNDGPDSFIGIPGPGAPSNVPEPTTLFLLGSGLLGLGGYSRKKFFKK